MIACKHYKNRTVNATFSSSTDFSSLENDYFHIILMKSGYAVLEANQAHVCINTPSILLMSKGLPISLHYENHLDVSRFSFHPDFFNLNLTWEMLDRPDYLEVASEYNFPTFTPFLEIGNNPSYFGFYPISYDIQENFQNLMNHIRDQITSQPTKNWSCSTRSYLIRILHELDRLYLNYFRNDNEKPTLIHQITDFIDLNISEDISLSDLCKHFHTNRTTLTQLFKYHTELSISQYINMRRLELVRNALLFTSLSVEEIAEQYGFHHTSYLSQLFKKNFHVSPIQYRKTEVTRRKRELSSSGFS